MQMPAATWEMTYASDRRKHSHRCQCCNKIVADGARVVMAKVSDKVTRVVHIECADVMSFDGYTFRQYLEAQAYMRLAACGYQQAKNWLAASPMSKGK